MTITWRDTELKSHEINLENAVDVKIDGIALSLNKNKGIIVRTDNELCVLPIAANCVVIKEKI